MSGWAATILVPLALWGLGHLLATREAPLPNPAVSSLIGFFAPAGLLRWCARPFPEQALATVISIVAWAGVFIVHEGGLFAALGLLTAAWGFGVGLRNVRVAAPGGAVEPAAVPAPPPAARRGAGAVGENRGEAGAYSLELRCPTCGATLAVPVYHRMTRCEFCGSEHVISSADDAMALVIPDAAASDAGLLAAVVKHLRHLHYLKLYDRRVRPLVEQSEYSLDRAGEDASFLAPPPTSPLVNAMELEVQRAAAAYAERIAPRLTLVSRRRFLAPYWHRFGTLYRSAFGRDAEGLKRMEFSVTTMEGSLSATTVPLPEMGKLSYLRSLRPLLGAPEAEVPALPVEVGSEVLDRRMQQLGGRSTGLAVAPIAVRATLVPEVTALVYRPWHVAELELDGDRFVALVDGGAGSVETEPPTVKVVPRPLAGLTGAPPTLTPSRCPECGGPLAFAPDSVAHLCRTCFRLVAMRGARWSTLPYLRERPREKHWMVPFWRFPLRLRTAAGDLITDLPHLTDGVDGSFDQIGDRAQTRQEFFVPAFRTRVSKAGLRFYRLLWPLVQGGSREMQAARFDPASPPGSIVDVTLPAAEARVFARVYLALAFTARDLARAEIKGVRERFLSAELEGAPELAFVALPDDVVAPVRALFGRARLAAIEELQGAPAPAG